MSYLNPILITQNGYNQLQADLAALVDEKRPALVNRLSTARSQGDLSENSDYISAKEELAFMDGQIAELEDVLRLAKITKPGDSGKVDFGHAVTVKIDGKQAVFTLVGEWESDPAQKKISITSPLGKAMLGKKIGDQVEVDAPAGKVLYTIVSIN